VVIVMTTLFAAGCFYVAAIILGWVYAWLLDNTDRLDARRSYDGRRGPEYHELPDGSVWKDRERSPGRDMVLPPGKPGRIWEAMGTPSGLRNYKRKEEQPKGKDDE